MQNKTKSKPKQAQNLYAASSTKSERFDRDKLKKKTRVLDLDDAPRPRPKSRSSRDTDDDEDDRPTEPRKKKVIRANRAVRAERAPSLDAAELRKKVKPGTDLVLPKKLRRDNLPATFAEKPKQRISKLNHKKMKSILGDSAEQIHQMLEANENESAHTLLSKRLLQEVLDLIPLAVNGVRKTKGQRGVYQVNSLITSIREIMLDIQAAMDKSSMAVTVVDQVLRPAWMDIAMALIEEDAATKALIRANVPAPVYEKVNKSMEESLKRVSNLMQRKFDDACTKASDMMKR